MPELLPVLQLSDLLALRLVGCSGTCNSSYESLEGRRSVTVPVWSAWPTAVDARSWKVGRSITKDVLYGYSAIHSLWNLRVHSAVNTLKSIIERSAFVEKQSPSETPQKHSYAGITAAKGQWRDKYQLYHNQCDITSTCTICHWIEKGMVRTYILMQFVFMMKTTNTWCIPHIQYSLTYLTAFLWSMTCSCLLPFAGGC